MSALAPESTGNSADLDDLCHVVCLTCMEALCGVFYDGEEMRAPGRYDDDCVVCRELDRRVVCVRCGAPPAPRT